MTKSFAVDSNNDLVIGQDDKLVMSTGLDAVLQNCAHAAKTILGEMVLQVNEGLPYFEAIWIGAPNFAVWEAAFRRRILAVEGVTGIVSLEIISQAGVMSYVASISTVYGSGVLNG